MKKTPQPSIDGFVPRRSGAILGKPQRPLGSLRPDLGKVAKSPKAPAYRPTKQIARSDIDDSLREIDEEPEVALKKHRFFGRRRTTAVDSPRRKKIKRIVLALTILLALIGAYVGIKALIASGSIFIGNPFDIFQNRPLQEDKNGRSNILIFGTSEDDPEHPGGLLTDSIMVLSINQTKKNAYMISVPRDLYIQYGAACPEGYQGKINSLYACYSDDGTKEAEGAKKLKQKVGEIFGLDIQYYAHLNYSVVKDAVNAVGGVDIKIESNPRGAGILDRNFDWKCSYRCYYVKYDDGQIAHLDGEHALALSRARNAAGGYGLAAGNFDREKNQQKIMKALRGKAVSAGTLTNVGKVTSLIDAFGKNLRTNFATAEIRTLMSLGSDIPSGKIQSVDLVKEGEAVLTTGNVGGASIVQPVEGLMEYGELQRYIGKQLNANEITREAAKIAVFNGSSTPGLAQTKADSLRAKGFTITAIANAPEGRYGAVTVYQFGVGKTATAAKLKELFGIKTIYHTNPPVTVAEDTDFVIIFGSDGSSGNS